MDKDLLFKVFRIPNPSNEETRMSLFIRHRLKEMNIPFKVDDLGNIYNLFHENRPLLSAHMDSITDRDSVKRLDELMIVGNTLTGTGAIGGDDKCGIYLVLKLLEKNPSCNFLFTVGEEVGAKGSSHFVRHHDMQHCLYGIVLDRMGSSDILCLNNSYGTKEFDRALNRVGEKFGYTWNTGLFSDADYLRTQISCCNLSVGYYNPHTDRDYVKLNELDNALAFAHAIINKIMIKYEKPQGRKNMFRRKGEKSEEWWLKPSTEGWF